MRDKDKTKEQLVDELVEMRQRVAELEILETEYRRTEEALSRCVREMKTLSEALLEINNTHLDIETLVQVILQRATYLLNVGKGGLLLIRPDSDILELAVGHNQRSAPLSTVLPMGKGLLGRVAQSGEPLMVTDYDSWEDQADSAIFGPIGRILGVPLEQGSRVFGVLTIFDDKKGYEFGERAIWLLNLFAAPAAIAINNARLYEHVCQELAERRQTEEVLQQALAKIKTLRGLLPICASCKRRRNDQDYWQQVEAYISNHFETDFSHGVCPTCMKKHNVEV
jgi:transcriptional regulator with GAF, ATPase, and Fis domain